MLKVFKMAAVAVAAGALAAACSHAPNHTSAPHASLSARVQCAGQMHTWEKTNHFSDLLKQLATDIRTLPSGSAAGDRTATKQVTAGLVSDVKVLQQHAAPGCVPGFNTQLNAGLGALLAADQASHSTSAASVQTASGDLHSAGQYLRTAADDAARYAATGTVHP